MRLPCRLTPALLHFYKPLIEILMLYEGFFESYFIRPFIHHYADFKGKEDSASCLKSVLAWVVITLGITGIMMGQVGIIGPEAGTQAAWTVCIAWLVLSVVPLAALVTRTLHGAPEKTHHPKFLGVDALLTVCSLLFFILGLLMMVTTLNSGELNPNANAYDDSDSAVIEEETYVKEEPIFTYQDESPETDIEDTKTDSLPELEEPYLVPAEESFDPALAIPADDSI